MTKNEFIKKAAVIIVTSLPPLIENQLSNLKSDYIKSLEDELDDLTLLSPSGFEKWRQERKQGSAE